MISLAWIIPVVIFSPVTLGWESLQPLLVKVLPNVRIREDYECGAEFMEDKWIASCLTFCYFWVTLAVMLYLYYEIYAVAVKMAKKSAEKRKNVANLFAVAEQGVTRIGVGLTQSLSPPGGPGQPAKPGQKPNTDHSSSSNPQPAGGQQRTSSVRQNKSDGEKSESALLGSESDADQNEPSKKRSGGPASNAGTNSAGKQCSGSSNKAAGGGPSGRGSGEKAAAGKSIGGGKKGGVFESFSRRIASFKARGRSAGRSKEKKKVENRARKALKTVTLIMGLYALCWTPYHINVLVNGFVKDDEYYSAGYIYCYHIHLFNLGYWACYINSPINPFSYAFVNVHFKKTFLRILKFDFSVK